MDARSRRANPEAVQLRGSESLLNEKRYRRKRVQRFRDFEISSFAKFIVADSSPTRDVRLDVVVGDMKYTRHEIRGQRGRRDKSSEAR